MWWRPTASVALATLGAVLAAVALVAGYARVAVLDSDQFADRAVAALREPAVREKVADQLTDEVVLRAERDLVAIRPLVRSAADGVVGSPPFQALFGAAVRDLHRTVFTDARATATTTVADVGVLLASALEQLDPQAAERVPRDLSARIVAGKRAVTALDAAQAVRKVAWLAFAAALGALLALAGAVVVAPQRRRGVVHAGIAVAVAGVVVAIALQIARASVLGDAALPIDRAAASAIWGAFLGDLLRWALATLAAGTVIAAAAASLLRPVDVATPLRQAWTLATTAPASPGRRVARAVALIAAGALIIAERRWMLDAALLLAGVFVLYHGVTELLRVVTVPRAPAADAGAVAPAAARRPRTPWIAAGVATAVVVVLVGSVFVTGGTRPAAATQTVSACNGHAALCDRRLDEVVFAGTHNAMSGATYPDWLFAQHERGLTGQLTDGVRALMIDAHFGRRVGDRVLTELQDETRAAVVEQLGERGTRAALRVRDALIAGDAERGPRTTWLCHGFCEVGAITLESGLREVADFLAQHHQEVVLIVIQDEGPGPRQIAAAVEASGLRPFVYAGPDGPPWPTLRELIRSGQRAIVMFEHGPADPQVPWYRDAYALMQETPYHFTDPTQFSCRPNRGPRTASLFLLNHWIDTSPAPRPSNAAIVNAADVLLDRARRCERERGRLPNVIAVDFYATGDLLEVVDTLNGVDGPTR